MSEQTFKVGDKVTHSSRGEGEVTYGPFTGAFGGTCYLVKVEDGREWITSTEELTTVPAFSVGDKVKGSYFGTQTLTVVSGPYASGYGGPVWVVVAEDGKHKFPDEDELTRVSDDERPFKVGDVVRVLVDGANSASVSAGDLFRVDEVESQDSIYVRSAGGAQWWFSRESVEHATHTEGGTTYDLSSKYKDDSGDIWSFTGRANASGEPFVTMSGTLTNTDTIAGIAADWGPMTRVTD